MSTPKVSAALADIFMRVEAGRLSFATACSEISNVVEPLGRKASKDRHTMLRSAATNFARQADLPRRKQVSGDFKKTEVERTAVLAEADALESL